MESDSGVGTGEKGSSVQGGSSSGYNSASTITNGTLQDDQRSGSSGFYSNPREAMESDSGVGTGASTITNGTLQGDHSLRSGSSGFYSNPREGNNSFLDSLPKQNMIDVFLRSEPQIKDKNTATRLQLRPGQTISDLQKMVQNATGIHPGQQHLCHEDTQTVLSDLPASTRTIMTMASCNVKHGSWLKYSARSRGGGGSVN